MSQVAIQSNGPYIFVPQRYENAIIRISELFEELCDNWQPNPPQLAMIKSVIFDCNMLTVCKWGRQTGKSEGVVAIAALRGQFVAGSQSYYLAPELKQAKGILWETGRIEEIVPENWIENLKETTSTVYWSGSRYCYLKVDGCDKFNKKRGISVKKGVLFLDECRDMPDSVYETLKPALRVHDCPTVLTSTPPQEPYPYPDEPKRQHWFNLLCDRAKVADKQRYLHYPTSANPYYPKESLDQDRRDYIDEGREYVFLREHEALDVVGGGEREWPMLAKSEKFVFPHEQLIKEIERDRSKLDWYVMTDPAGGSVWAWLFIALNPYTRDIYFLDEIYEMRRDKMVPSLMWARALVIILELRFGIDYSDQLDADLFLSDDDRLDLAKLRRAQNDIIRIYQPEFDSISLHYDEAETWFANDMSTSLGITFYPSEKKLREKKEGFRLYSNLFRRHKVKFSDRVASIFWEFQNYEEGTKRDHGTDLGRYFLNVSNYTEPEEDEPKPPTPKPNRVPRGYRPEDDYEQQRSEGDWTSWVD